MGAKTSTLKPVIEKLVTSTTTVGIQDEEYWAQFWPDTLVSAQQYADEITPENIRSMKKTCPKNLGTLCRRAVLTLDAASKTGMASGILQAQAVNIVRLLARITPYLYEDQAWEGFYWTETPTGVVVTVPTDSTARPLHDGAPETARFVPTVKGEEINGPIPLALTLVNALLDLMFAPGFTCSRVPFKRIPHASPEPEGIRPVNVVDGSEYIWCDGVGFKKKVPRSDVMEEIRIDMLRLLLALIATPLYASATAVRPRENPWLSYITSGEHRNTQALVQSLLNLFITHDPVGYGIPYAQMLVPDQRGEQLASLSGQLLAVLLDYSPLPVKQVASDGSEVQFQPTNVMSGWIASIHEEEEFSLISKGLAKLLNSPLESFMLVNSGKRVQFEQELAVLFWKLCDLNKKFLVYILKSKEVLDILVPVLYYVNKHKEDISQIGFVHLGVYIMLLLSGERNFSVRLNKPYEGDLKWDIPFTGSHGDLVILVVHNLLICRNERLTGLYDCLCTILANISAYLKSVSLLAANKLVHLFEVFTSKTFILADEMNHHLSFFLLEVFNNLIQYQFEGNQQLVYVIIRRRKVFFNFLQLKSIAFDPEKKVEEPNTAVGHAVVFSPEKPLPSVVDATAASPDRPAVIRSTLPAEDGKEHFTVTEEGAGVAKEKEEVIIQSPPEEEEEAFVPTPEWMDSWFSKLPFETIKRLLQVLVPQVEKMCAEKGVTDEAEILEFLKNGTLVGLLPVPHPILIRKYQTNTGGSLWYNTFVWSFIYLKNMNPPLFHGSHVKLFHVQEH